MEGQSSVFCSIFETDSNREARLCIARLQTNPIPIWWYRRRVHTRDDEKEKDLSPFPKSWSLNYSPQTANEFRKGVDILVDEDEKEQNDSPVAATETDESSMYSTVSQEKRNKLEQLRDGQGNCIHHPSVKLAEKKHMRKPRLSKIFGKSKRMSSSGESQPADEWTILLEECPECKLDAMSNSKRRSRSDNSSETNIQLTYEPFPATITIVEAHPHLAVGALALQIRTDPIPTDQTRQLSCVLDERTNNEEVVPWTTPDGALDFVFPCDSEGTVLKDGDSSQSTNNQDNHQYQIMERIIPLSTVDHISRGGDAWDVLRRSVGEEDLGCKCDLKIHGFSDRLLRFDVIGFGKPSETHEHKIRHSFAVVDFLRSSVSYITKKSDEENIGLGADDQWELGHYTSENVMTKMNSLVMWDRERRETGVEGWADCLTTCLEEYLSLGVPSAGRKFVPVEKKRQSGLD